MDKTKKELLKATLDEGYTKFNELDEKDKRELFDASYMAKGIVDGLINYIKSRNTPIDSPEAKDEFNNIVHSKLMGYCLAMVDLGYATLSETKEPANE